MSSTVEVVDPVLWHGVQKRPGPSRVVVVLALMIAASLVVAASTYRSRGMYAPLLSTSGYSSEWDAARSTLSVRMELNNRGDVPLSVTGGRIVVLSPGETDDPPVFTQGPFAGMSPLSISPSLVTSFQVTPVDIPAGLQRDTTMTVGVDCNAYPLAQGAPVVVVLTTTGTWPEHEVAVGELSDVEMSCTPPPDS